MKKDQKITVWKQVCDAEMHFKFLVGKIILKAERSVTASLQEEIFPKYEELVRDADLVPKFV